MYGFIGFIIGFLAGVAVNAYLLKGVPRDKLMKNRNMRLLYGGLNWGIAFLGMIVGIAISRAQ